MRRYLALLPLLAVLAGCGTHLKDGHVYGKRYEPESTTFVLIPIQTGSICSGNGICTPIFMSFPFWWHDDEDYVLQLEKGDKTDDVYVSRDIYEHTAVGDDVDFRSDKEKAADVCGDDCNNERRPAKDSDG